MATLALASWTVFLRAQDRKIEGLSALDVINGLKDAKIAETDLIWTSGQPDWIEARTLRELLIDEIRNRRPSGARNGLDATISYAKPADTDEPRFQPRTEAKPSIIPPADAPGDISPPSVHPSPSRTAAVSQVAIIPDVRTSDKGERKHADTASSGTHIDGDTAIPASDFIQQGGGEPVGEGDTVTPIVAASTDTEIDQTDLGEFNPEETGTIASYVPDKRYGMIAIEGKPKLHFVRRALPQNAPRELVGLKVLANIVRDRKGITASSVKILDTQVLTTGKAPAELAARYYDELRKVSGEANPGRLLAKWSNLDASLPRVDPGAERPVRDSIPKLASICLNERWCFDYDMRRDEYAILRKYITYTFYRLFREGKIAFSATHATFNTGLVDKLFEPIYALFVRNSRLGSRPYRFVEFCVAGDENSGKELMAQFAKPDRPEPAQYMTSFDEVIFDPSCHVTIQYKHVIDDAVLRARYPLEFLLKHLPSLHASRWGAKLKR